MWPWVNGMMSRKARIVGVEMSMWASPLWHTKGFSRPMVSFEGWIGCVWGGCLEAMRQKGQGLSLL